MTTERQRKTGLDQTDLGDTGAGETAGEKSPLAHWGKLIRDTIPPMHPAGRPFVLAFAVASLLLRRLWRPAGVLGGIATAWCAWFFRVPTRTAPSRRDLAVAPADGTVSEVTHALPPAELELGQRLMTRVSVFLTIFDVHAQRLPINGEVRKLAYRPGAFLSADRDKASDDNERNAMLVRADDGTEVVAVQIAGLVARRIVCSLREGDKAAVGDTYGLIRFGSRVDLYVPTSSRVLVEAGQRTVGGETPIAELRPGGETA